MRYRWPNASDATTKKGARVSSIRFRSQSARHTSSTAFRHLKFPQRKDVVIRCLKFVSQAHWSGRPSRCDTSHGQCSLILGQAGSLSGAWRQDTSHFKPRFPASSSSAWILASLPTAQGDVIIHWDPLFFVRSVVAAGRADVNSSYDRYLSVLPWTCIIMYVHGMVCAVSRYSPSGKAGKQEGLGSTYSASVLHSLQKGCGLWTLSCDFVPQN